MTLFKKNFSYKRGWQFANKLKLSTLFFVMLTSLIAGATSVSAQSVLSKEGWVYYAKVTNSGGVIATLNYEGEVACLSDDGVNCIRYRPVSDIIFADVTVLKCGPDHKAIYKSSGYDKARHWCSKLKIERIKKGFGPVASESGSSQPNPPTPPSQGGQNISPEGWAFYSRLGIVAHLNFQGEVACISDSGTGCRTVRSMSDVNFRTRLKVFKCGPDHTTVYGYTGYNRIGYWCKELKAIRDGQTNPPTPPTPPAPVDPPSQGGQNISPEGWAFYSRFGIVAKLNYQGEVACISDSGTGCRTVRSISDVNFRTRLKVFKCGPDHTTVYGYTGYNRAGYWCKELRAIRDGQTNPPTPPAPVDPPSQGGQNISPEGWAFYSRFRIVAKLNYQGEVACISDSGTVCRTVRSISDVNFRTRLKVLKCGSDHTTVYGYTGYNRVGYWCKELKAINGNSGGGSGQQPGGGSGLNPQEWNYYPDPNGRIGIVASLNYQGEVACVTKGQGCLKVRSKSEIRFAEVTTLKCGSDHEAAYNGEKGYGRRGHWCERLRMIRDGQTNPPTPPAPVDPPSQGGQVLNSQEWKYYSNINGGIVASLNYQGEVACILRDERSCISGKRKSEINFSRRLKVLKCGTDHGAIYNGEKGYGRRGHWCEVLRMMSGQGTPDKPDVSGGKPNPPTPPAPVDPPSQGGQVLNSQEWKYYSNINGGIVASLNYQGEVACILRDERSCISGKRKSEINFSRRLKVLKCGTDHGAIYNGEKGYGRRGHWCEVLRMMSGQGTPDKPDVSGGKPNPPTPPAPPAPVDPGTPDKPKPPVDPGTPDKPKPPVDPGTPDKPKPPVDPGTPDKPKPPVDPGTPDKPDVSGGKPGEGNPPSRPAPGTGPELTSKPDQLKWFSGKDIGFNGVITLDFQGQAACASTDGASCLKNVAMKDINFATLNPIKCGRYWCSKFRKHAVFLSLQSREYYARPTIDGSKYVKGYQPVVQGEPGSVLALSGSFMDLAADSLSYEYADLEFKKVMVSNLAIPVSCSSVLIYHTGGSVSEVVNNIEATSDICAQEFFKVARLQQPIVVLLFKPEVVQEVVNRLQAYLTPWDGVIKNKEIYNLTVFLRAYKYVRFYNPSIVPANPALETKITALFSRGLTYGNGFFGMDAKLEKIRTNSLQSSMLYELIMAQGNYNSWSSDGIEYITKVIRDFNPATFNTLSVKERTAVARIISSIFAALYYDNTIVGKIENDPLFLTAYKALVAELVKFAFDKKVASYPNLALNAARESLRYPHSSSKRPEFTGINRYAGIVGEKDSSSLDAIITNAVYPNSIPRRIIDSIFPMTYNCGDASVEFHYDTASTTQGEIMQLCTDFITTSTEFASKMGITLSAPLESNDMKGHTLKMYVYNNENDWRLYGKSLFNLGTSSPGAFVDNYKKSKAPEAHIFRTESDLTFGKAPFWNAVHEYTHYLVSKYITKGGSAELTMAQVKGLVWYEEGLAEYFHSELYRGRDVTASSASNYYLPWLQRAKADGFVLRSIGERNLYHAYSGGYAVVKYLLEERVGTFQGLIARLRAGDLIGFNRVVNTVIAPSPSFNQGFNAWLQDKAK